METAYRQSFNRHPSLFVVVFQFGTWKENARRSQCELLVLFFKYVYKWYVYKCMYKCMCTSDLVSTMDTYVPTSLHATLIWSPPSFPSWTRVSFFLAPNRWSVEFQTSEKQLHKKREVVQFKKYQKHRGKKPLHNRGQFKKYRKHNGGSSSNDATLWNTNKHQ